MFIHHTLYKKYLQWEESHTHYEIVFHNGLRMKKNGVIYLYKLLILVVNVFLKNELGKACHYFHDHEVFITNRYGIMPCLLLVSLE